MLERWTREQLSDGEVVLYRRWVEGCAAAVAALLVLVVAAWRHLPHSVEEFVAATILLPVILLAYLVVCRLRWRGWFALDLGREVARRAFLLGRLVDRLEHGTSRRAGQHAAVAGFLDGQPVGARVWVDPRAEAPLDALLCHVVFEGPLRCRLSPRPALDGGPPALTGEWLAVEGASYPRQVDDDPRARGLLGGLFQDDHARRLTFDRDGLTAELPANLHTLDPARLRGVLERLIAFCREVGALPRVRSGDVAVTARPAAERCPYCRDEIHPGARARCDACRTPHHDACLDEAGCTVLGCREARPRGERARA